MGKITLNEDNENGSLWMTSKNFTLHPKFDGKQIFNDIALVFLPSEVSFNANIRPACLPSQSMTENNLVGYTATGMESFLVHLLSNLFLLTRRERRGNQKMLKRKMTILRKKNVKAPPAPSLKRSYA